MLHAVSLCLLASASQWLGPPMERSAQPLRIVSLAPSLTEILFAIGAGEQVVAVTRFDDFPPQVQALPKVGGFVDPDVEAVLAAHPTLVVAVHSSGAFRAQQAIAQRGVPVRLFAAESIDDLWAAMTELGQLTGRSTAAEKLTLRLQDDLASLAAQQSQRPPLRALVVVGYRPLIVAGPGSFLDRLLALVNARNVVQRGGTFPHIDWEAAAASRPDVVIEATWGEESHSQAWARLAALGQKPPRVVRLQDSTLLRLGPRLAEGLRKLAKAITP